MTKKLLKIYKLGLIQDWLIKHRQHDEYAARALDPTVTDDVLASLTLAQLQVVQTLITTTYHVARDEERRDRLNQAKVSSS